MMNFFRTPFWSKVRTALTIALAASFAIGLLGQLKGPPGDRLPKGMALPDMTLPYVTGNPGDVSLAGLKGKPLVLNFWASWCGPCKHELPVLKSLYHRYKNQDVVILGVTDDSPAHIRAVSAQNDLPYATVFDKRGRLGRRLGVRTIPFTVFVSKDGHVSGDVTGTLAESEGIERIDQLLSESDSSE